MFAANNLLALLIFVMLTPIAFASECKHLMSAATSTKLRFVPEIKILNKVPAVVRKILLQEEPMLRGADFDYAMQSGGEITRGILRELQKDSYLRDVIAGKFQDRYISIDTKVVNLKSGDFPNIPGWHTDFVPLGRPMEPHDYLNNPSGMGLYAVSISDQQQGVSGTEFIDIPVSLQFRSNSVHQEMDEQVEDSKNLPRMKATDGDIYFFSPVTIHQASAAHAEGMRYFFRLAVLSEKPKNEVRKFVQSYRVAPTQFKTPTVSSSVFPRMQLHPTATSLEIREEPMLVDADLNFALKNGGPLTRSTIQKLLMDPEIIKARADGKVVSVNTRVHNLMGGQAAYSTTWSNRPPFVSKSADQNARHFLVTVGSKTGNLGSFEFLEGTAKTVRELKQGEVLLINANGSIRAREASTLGWQLSLIVSIENPRVHQNEITQQSLVYLSSRKNTFGSEQ